jgi:hypothetical protein
MLDGWFVDVIPYVLPGTYVLALRLLHIFVIVRPTQTLLWERTALADDRDARTAGAPAPAESEKPSPASRRVGWWARPSDRIRRHVPRQADILAGWRSLHRRDVDRVATMEHEEVLVQLRTRVCELPGDDCGEEARALAATMAERLDPDTTRTVPTPGAGATAAAGTTPAAGEPPDSRHVLVEARITLQRVLTLVHGSHDSAYEEAADVYRKAVWLALIGALGIIALGATINEGHAFFLVGAVGGLMSRLTRVLSRRPRANDYGASWSTLILAPISGGLAGWLGVMLTEALADPSFGVLAKGTFEGIFSSSDNARFTGADATLALAVAFVFGFSERLINRAATAAEERVVPKLPTAETKA